MALVRSRAAARRRNHFTKSAALCSVSFGALVLASLATPAAAQTPPAPQTTPAQSAQATGIEEVVVTATRTGGSSGGTGGIISSNLRNLGAFRTLVLLDGRRVVGASFSLAPDIGEFPQALISRVDVVTGGASAAW